MGSARKSEWRAEGIDTAHAQIIEGRTDSNIVEAFIDEITTTKACFAFDVDPADCGIGKLAMPMAVDAASLIVCQVETDQFFLGERILVSVQIAIDGRVVRNQCGFVQLHR